jgi:hypothetical protein
LVLVKGTRAGGLRRNLDSVTSSPDWPAREVHGIVFEIRVNRVSTKKDGIQNGI